MVWFLIIVGLVNAVVFGFSLAALHSTDRDDGDWPWPLVVCVCCFSLYGLLALLAGGAS